MFWWILTAITAYKVIELAFATIEEWFARHKIGQNPYGELIRERLDSGQYKVISGVFDERGIQTTSETWVVQTLDQQIESIFGYYNRIRVEL